MATLERIRRRSGLLIVVIGMAMGAFILTDLLSSGGLLLNDTNNMGSIDGEKITRKDFIGRITKLKQSNPQYAQLSEKTLADVVWNQLERDVILGEECNKLGLSITPAELKFAIKNSPEIARAFTDPQTGQFSEVAFSNYYTSLEDAYLAGNDPKAIEGWNQWVEFEKGMKQQALATKYNTAVQYGIYVPTALAKQEYVKTSENVQGKFIQLPFSSIVDSTVEISESDLKSYYNSHKAAYEKKASTSFDYVTFDIVPSQEDKDEVLAELNGLIEDKIEKNTVAGYTDTIVGFKNAKSDSAFVNMYSDVPFDDKYYTKGELPSEIDTIAFNNEIGFIDGPHLEGNNYVVRKISGIMEKPDSVKARHILISYQGAKNGDNSTRSGQEAMALSDSLLKLVQDDASIFDTLSAQYNDDAVAKTKGGDLGWFNETAMVPNFAKFSFRHKAGDVGIAYTEFGAHIIIIDATKGANKAVRVATLSREVRPSQTTIENIHREAAMFASEGQKSDDFAALAQQKGYLLRHATEILKSAESVPGLGQNREIVKWTFGEDRKVNDINVFSTDKQHITVILTAQFEEGIAPLAQVEKDVKSKVLKEKKAEQLIAKFNAANATDIDGLASALGTQARPQATSMSGSALSGIGPEPKVVGTLCGMELNKLSKPIVGNTGVFVVSISQRGNVLDKQDYTPEQDQLQRQVRDLVNTQIFNSLKASADIEDLHNDIY